MLVLTAMYASPLLAADVVLAPPNCNETGFVAALNQVQTTGGGTLSFNCGATPLTIPLSSYQQISTDVIIDGGNRITIDAGHNAAFFQIFASARLELRRLVLTRGTQLAAYPLENFGELRLDGVTVQNCNSTALLNLGNASIFNSRFVGNQSASAGAAIDIDAGTVTITASEFIDNVVNGGNSPGTGGAIILRSSDMQALTIRDSVFRGNRAFDGGALHIGANTVGTRVARTLFDANIAGYGGAIETRGNGFGIRNSVFSGNQAQVGDGGAIWALQGGLFVFDSEFTGNSANTTGGALSCYGNSLNIFGSAFSGNQSVGHGGALYSTCAMLSANSTFHNNHSTGPGNGGGAIYQNSSSGFVYYLTISNNSASYGAGIASDGNNNAEVQAYATMLVGNSGGNCGGVFASSGYNLSSDSHCGGAFTATGDLNSVALALQPLGNYGGPTSTRPPQAGNPAINRIPLANCSTLFTLDQRGGLRPANGACDTGAVELGSIIDVIFADGFE